MGRGYEWKCPNCKYKFSAMLGSGFSYPMVYENTIEQAMQGKFGEKIKNLLEVYPDVAIDPETVLLQCADCGEYDSRPLLTSYIFKDGIEKPEKEKGKMWSSAAPFYEESYVTSKEMQEFYDVYSVYDHRCKKCGGNMVVISSDCYEKEGGMICPRCKKTLKRVAVMLWD
jgi:hypothetical protein